MILEIETQGVEETSSRLQRLGRRIASTRVSQVVLRGIIEKLQRFAVGISPVVTGAYQSSHRIAVKGTTARLFIDPTVRNPVSGQSVTRYAVAVEERHAVYERTAEEAYRLGAEVAEDWIKEVVR